MSSELKRKLLASMDRGGYQVHESEIEDVHQEGENYIFISSDDNDDTYSVSRWFTKARDFGASNLIEGVTYEEASKFLQEHLAPKIEPAEFEDSVQATEFMETIQDMLSDPRLHHWIRETDSNYGSNLLPVIEKMQQDYDQFFDTMCNVGV